MPRIDPAKHTGTIKLLAGESSGPTLVIECHETNLDGPCRSTDPNWCWVRETFSDVDWECVRAAGEIIETRVSIGFDYTDVEEPWLELEP